MSRTLKILSILLTYPTPEIKAAACGFAGILDREGLLTGTCRSQLAALAADLSDRDLLDSQERYVLLFDRTRSLSLHLFEHIHGESRDRGQAMVDLKALYERHGLHMGPSELPDFLPLFLEFVSTRSPAEARGLLRQPLHIVSALKERLRKRKSVYACVFEALEEIAGGDADENADDVQALLREADDRPEDLQALDREWAEEPVTFGAGSAAPGGGCPAARDALARMDLAASKEQGNG